MNNTQTIDLNADFDSNTHFSSVSETVQKPTVDNPNSEAYYASVLSGSEDPVGMYEQMLDEYETRGVSASVDLVRSELKKFSDLSKMAVVENIIADDSIAKNEKSQILRDYAYGEELEPSLQDEYLNYLSNLKLARDETELSPENLEKVDYKIATLKINQELEKATKAFETFGDKVYTSDSAFIEDVVAKSKKVSRNLIDLIDNYNFNVTDPVFLPYREVINFARGLIGVPQFFIELASTIAIQGLSKVGELTGIEWLQQTFPDISWGEAFQKIQKLGHEYGYIENIMDPIIDKVLLDKEEFEKGFVAGAFQTIDDVAQYIGDKISPDDPERVKVPLLFSLFFVNKAYRSIKGLKEPKVKETESYADLKTREEGAGPGTPNKLKASVQSAIEQKNRTKAEQVNHTPEINSPFRETVELNPEMAADLGNVLMTDLSGQSFKALNITPVQLLMTYLGPTAFERIKSPQSFFDGLESARINSVEQLIERSKNIALFEPTFLDVKERIGFGEAFIKDAGAILEHPDVRMIGSSVDVRSTGTSLVSSVDFRKSSTEYYQNPYQVANILKYIEPYIKNSDGVKGTSVIKVETIDANNSRIFYTPESFLKSLSQIENAKVTDMKYNIRWEKQTDFVDSIKAGSEGFGYQGHQNKVLPLRALYALPKAWNMFFNYGRLSKEVQIRRDMAGLRALGLMNDKLSLILDMVNKEGKVFRNDLAVVYSKMGKYDRVLTYNDIVKELNYNPKAKHVNKIQEVLQLTDEINYFTWQMQNMYDITTYTKAGYGGHVTIGDKNFMVKTKRDLAIDLENVSAFYDISKQSAFEFKPTDYMFRDNKHLLVDEKQVPYAQLYRLGETFIDGLGDKYNYISLPVDAVLPGAPSWIIPYRRNYMPGMTDNTVFVRRYPKRIKIDGKVRDLRKEEKNFSYLEKENPVEFKARQEKFDSKVVDQMTAHREAVAGFNSKVEAQAWLDSKTKDSQYVYTVEKASELNAADVREYQVLQENALRASRKRGNSLEFAIYEDPLTSLIETSKVAGVRYLMQNSADQLKIGWLKRWGESSEIKLQENTTDIANSYRQRAGAGFDATLESQAALLDRFPLEQSQIGKVPGKEKLHTQALEEWEAITNMNKGFEDNVISVGINKLAEYGGELAEQGGWKRIEKAMLRLERNPNAPTDILTKIPTTMYVSIANPVKHWVQQPFQGLGYMTIASNGNPLTFYSIAKDAVNTGRTLLMKNFRKQDFEKYIYDHMNKIENVAGEGRSKLTHADHMYILKYGREAGLFRMDEHTFARDTFFHKAPGLVREGFLKRNARAFTNTMSTIGLQTGEFVHRLAAFHSSKHIWQERNPGKNWKTSKAMDEIIYGARQLTQSMDAMASNTFQRVGILKPFAMLQTFVVRSAESAISGEATPFSGKQRAALAGFNVATYGIGAGLPLGMGYYILKLISETLGEDVAQQLDEKALVDIGYQLAYDSLFPTFDPETGEQIYTTTRPSGYLSPNGGADAPFSFYGTFVKAAAQTFAGVEFEGGIGRGNVAATYWKNAGKNIEAIYNMFGYNQGVPTLEKIQFSVEKVARLSSLGNTIYNQFLYDAATRMYNSKGAYTEQGKASIGDQVGSFLLNTIPETVKAKMKYLNEDTRSKDYMDKLAKSVLEGYRVAMKTSKMTPAELVEGFKGIYYLGSEGLGWSEKEFIYFSQALDKYNAQMSRGLNKNILNAVVQEREGITIPTKDEENLRVLLNNAKKNPNLDKDLITIIDMYLSRIPKGEKE